VRRLCGDIIHFLYITFAPKLLIINLKKTYTIMILGAIIGDTAGSIYEFDNIKTTDFEFFGRGCDFTDDSIMTVAVAEWLLVDPERTHDKLVECMQTYGKRYPYPMGAYGGRFSGWLRSQHPMPYNSWGNGSAMRASATGWACDTLEETLRVAKISAEVTHNHPEGVKGAQATAAAIFMARNGKSKAEIKDYVSKTFGYNLDRSCDEIRPGYDFDESCKGTVPEAIIAFLDSTDFESAIRLAISLGGDSDTLACITGGIAEAFYKQIPDAIHKRILEIIPEDFKKVLGGFN